MVAGERDQLTMPTQRSRQRQGKTVERVVATLHTTVLETPTVGPRAGVRPRVTNGGSGKEGNRKMEGSDCTRRWP